MPDDDNQGELAALRARVATLEAEASQRLPRWHRLRAFLSALLIIIGCVLAPLGIVAAWTSSIVGDTDRYVTTVAPLASNPDVQAAAANRVTGAVMEHIDLPNLLEDVAPDQRPLLQKALGKLGNGLEGAVRSFVHEKALDVVQSNAFETIWTNANRTVHTSLVRALTGSDEGAVQIKNDSVTIDLAPVIDQVKNKLVDSGMSVAAKIPEVHTDFTVLKSDDIGRVKTGFRLLEIMGFWLPVIAVVLAAVGVLLSVHRRRTLVTAALGFAVAALILGIALTVFRTVYLNALPDTVSQPAAGAVYDAMIKLLRTTVRMVAVLGVLLALAAWLSGPGRRATVVRQMWQSGIAATRASADRAGLRTGPVGAFVGRHRTWITWILVAATVLALILWPYPTGWVILGLALALLFALAVMDFLAEEDAPDAEDAATPPGGSPPRPV